MDGRKRDGLLLLTAHDLASAISFQDYVDAVADGFRHAAAGRAIVPPPMHLPAATGGFHVKAALLGDYVAVKVNGNFPGNRARTGLPTIQGAILLADTRNGRPLALIDSAEITRQRTAAATAIAARHLARPDSRVAAICGAGEQGRVQLLALAHTLPIERARVWDIDPGRASALARGLAGTLGIEVAPVATVREACGAADVIATCTPATEPFLGPEDVRPGTFIAAVGADSPAKGEIRPALMARATIIADVAAQCAVMGDLHHAIRAEFVRAEDVAGELCDLVAGRHKGRTRADEIVVFDSTGTAIEDVAAAARAYERAVAQGIGRRLALSDQDIEAA